MPPVVPAGVYRATIRAIDGPVAKVQVHNLLGANILPARLTVSAGIVDAAVGAVEAPADEGTVALRPLQVDDEVIVGFLEGRIENLVILGRLA